MKIQLKEMTVEQFNIFKEHNIVVFGTEHAQSKRIPLDEGISFARAMVDKILPQGNKTENHYFFQVMKSDLESIGYVWYEVQKPSTLFLFDIEIYESYRGQKFGEQVMRELEDQAKDHALESIELHVFGHNKIARNLYEKMGFEPTNFRMRKVV
jgi:ribosomal protein S18 acetylase RimI-like enzyme